MMKMRPTFESKRELITLCHTCGIGKDSIVVEIGSYAGESSEVFAVIAGTVYCIDPWIPGSIGGIVEAESKFDDMVMGHSNIRKCKISSVKYAMMVPDNSVDLVYIDGNHDEESVREDILSWMPKVKKGCWISGHDYNSNYPGLVSVVNEILGKPDHTFECFSWGKKL